ncbi:hypothetical protein [Candidatus Thiosymbion oneisti]|uniref:hypothetical protein n=1 Tax=Candidatus Thiosymbion oneisti TaxID=589554 RepID=UPI000B7CC6AE|nr:hypothetical protein [Candidatus Thiosymbion oneisti]
MIDLVEKQDLAQYHRRCHFDYASYLDWLDEDEISSDYHVVSTANIQIRDRSEWNTLGREIHDVERLRTHAQEVCKIVRSLGVKTFVAQHEYLPGIWFPEHLISEKSVADKISYIRSKVGSIDISRFDGGFRIEDEICDFVGVFIDYPFLKDRWHYKDIDIISMERDLIIKINHHLSIQFVTSSRDAAEEILGLCGETDIISID